MADNDTARRVEQLREQTIRKLDYHYYVLDSPLAEDSVSTTPSTPNFAPWRDSHPELATPDSPTQRIGGHGARGFRAGGP